MPAPLALDVPDADLERIAALGWRGLDATLLGDWLLRAAEGWTGRANSVLPLGDPGCPYDEAFEFVRTWYAERGLPARFQVPMPLCAEVDAALDARGWPSYNPTFQLVQDVPVLAELARPDLPPLSFASRPDDEWLATYHYRGGSLPAIAAAVFVNAADPVFATVRDGDEVVAIARAVVDEGWLGVTAVEVAESARRRGLGSHVMAGLAAWSLDHGARHCYLQVAVDNTAARGLYERLGFAVHHRYHYRQQPPDRA